MLVLLHSYVSVRYGQQVQRMDLVYVTERIISLAFPPDLDDATYTVHLRDVAHMLSSKHGDNFRVRSVISWLRYQRELN